MSADQPLPEKSAEVKVLFDEDDDSDDDSDQLEAELGKITELGQTLIDAVLEYVPIEDVQKLMDEEAPLWYQDECGWSALHAAASVENAELVKCLLQRGALWNAGKTRSPYLITSRNADLLKQKYTSGWRWEHGGRHFPFSE